MVFIHIIIACMMVIHCVSFLHSPVRNKNIIHNKMRLFEGKQAIDVFPELEELFAKSSTKLKQERTLSEEKSNLNKKIKKETLFSIVETQTDISAASAAESIKNLMQFSEGGISSKHSPLLTFSSDQKSLNENELKAIEEAKKKVTYYDKTGVKHNVPICANPLWYSISVRNGKEKKVLETFQEIIHDANHPLNPFIVDTFVHFRPGVVISDGKSKKTKGSPDLEKEDILPTSGDMILTGGQYGYAPRKTQKHLKFTTFPSAKGVVFIKAKMNPVIHSMIMRDVPNLLRFAVDEEGCVFPIVDTYIKPLLEDRQALFPEEQLLAKQLVVGSYVKLKERQRKDELPNEGYGFILGVKDGYIRVSVKCAKQDLEAMYDIRELAPIEDDSDEFQAKDENSRIKQMLERLMEQEPKSRILREFKRKGILDDFLYPERRSMRRNVIEQSATASNAVSTRPVRNSNVLNKMEPLLSTQEAQVAASFGGLTEMHQSMRELEILNKKYEKATRKKLTTEEQFEIAAASTGDDYSFLDELLAPAPDKSIASGVVDKSLETQKISNASISIDDYFESEPNTNDSTNQNSSNNRNNRPQKIDQGSSSKKISIKTQDKKSFSSVEDELDAWFREQEESKL